MRKNETHTTYDIHNGFINETHNITAEAGPQCEKI